MTAGVRPGSEGNAAIDGLRGVAALMVVASHASGWGMNLVPGVSLAGIGKHGVYLFFAISAYLLTAQWLDATPAQRQAPRFWLLYLRRRLLRIYPLYGLVLLIGWALAPRGLGVPLDGEAVWRHLTLQEGRSIYWSVPVEFLYYLVIPPLALWLGSRLPPVLSLGGVLVALGLLMTYWPSAEAPANGITLAYYLPVFVCGSLAAWARQWVGGIFGKVGVSGALRDSLLLALFVLTIPTVSTALRLGNGSIQYHQQLLLWGLAWAAVLLALRVGWLPYWSRVLCSAGLRACGRWCFGLYLLHMPALLLVNRLVPVPTLARAWLGLALSIGIAALTYRLVERPCQRLWQASELQSV